VDHETGRFSVRASEPGDCGFDVEALPDDEDAPVERPEAKAVRSQEVQIVQDLQNAPEFEPYREDLQECGYQTMVAIPVAYGNISYGILAIYDESPTAFVDTDPENLERLGEIIGHATTSVARRNALVSDAAIQLTFRQDCPTVAFATNVAGDWTLEFERLVQKGSGILAYGVADGISEAELRDVVDRSSDLEDLRVLSPGADEYEIELTTSWGSQLVSALAEHGAFVTAVTVADGECQFVVEVPPGRDKHRLVELVTDHHPDATLRAQQTVHRDEPGIADFHTAFEDRLTAKQRAVLETAYHSGYFDWPRGSTGEEIADRLGVTQATVSEHFRSAERTLFEAVFETDETGETMPASPWQSAGRGVNGD
jgi:predicted DNA binding protein